MVEDDPDNLLLTKFKNMLAKYFTGCKKYLGEKSALLEMRYKIALRKKIAENRKSSGEEYDSDVSEESVENDNGEDDSG